MELHEQQQRHLQPDVVPTPYSRATTSPGKRADGQCRVLENNYVEETVTPSPESQQEAASIQQTTSSRSDVRSPSDLTPVAAADLNEPVCAPSYNFGQYPMTMTCPCCDYTILTYVQYDISMKQYMICILLCMCFMWPCSLMPCLFRGMYDVYHFCPVCRRLIGVYKA